MKREGLASRFLAQLAIDVQFFPSCKPFRLAFGQTCAHWEICAGQVECGFIVGCFGAHIERPFSSYFQWNSESGVRVSNALARQLIRSERRGYNSNNVQ